MIPDQAAYDFIRSFEGCILHPYLDTTGTPTIGIGSIMYKDGTRVKIGDSPITIAQAQGLFRWQVGLKAAAVNGLHILFNQNQFNALLSFCYNEGVGALAGSTLIRKARVDAKDPAIAAEFAKWNKIKYIKTDGTIGYTVSESLTHRRYRESTLYFTPMT